MRTAAKRVSRLRDRYAIAAGQPMLPLLEAEAAERQKASRAIPGEKIGANVVEKIPPPSAAASKAREQAAKVTGTNAHYVSDAKKLKAEHPELFDKLKAGELTTPEAKAVVKQGKKAAIVESIKSEPPAHPTGPFRVIVIDPPWKYGARAEDATHRARNP